MLNETSEAQRSAPNIGLKSMVYAVDVGGLPTVAFEAVSLAKARTLSRELWFRVDVASVTANGAPLWDGETNLAVRPATSGEMNLFWRTAEVVERPSEALAYLRAIDPV
jgi:hypothetical protein